MAELVWYAAYGSNLSCSRFLSYLEGGPAAGRSRPQRGSRDPSPPRADRPIELPLELFFAGTTTSWGRGGVAFVRSEPSSRADTLGRAYLVTAEQFADVFAQESGQDRVRVPLERLAREGRLRLAGNGRYDLLVHCGEHRGHPVVTFTAPPGGAPEPFSRPSVAYLHTMVTGLRESHRLDDGAVASYLSTRLGMEGPWPAGERAAVLGLDPPRPVDDATGHAV